MKIAIDLDKTLIDCDSFIYWVANKFFSKPSEKNLKFNLIFTGNEGSDGLISKFLSKFSKMGKPESYFQIPNAIDVVNSWYDKGIEIYILSSRPNFSSLNYALHQYFLKMNLKYSAMIVNCNNKASFCERFNIDLLIDNSPSICLDAMNIGVDVICLNDAIFDEKFKNMIFANNWKQLNDIILNKYLAVKNTGINH